ncbi:hypothetical protein ACROYT_G020361 [Oculina patagonica]
MQDVTLHKTAPRDIPLSVKDKFIAEVKDLQKHGIMEKVTELQNGNKPKKNNRKTEFSYLTVVLTDKGVKPDPKKQDCIQTMPETETEKRYSQTEKEMLSIVFGFTRFYAYTYGRRVTICNGHKPLAVVLKNKAQTILLDSRECYAESSNMTFRIDQT